MKARGIILLVILLSGSLILLFGIIRQETPEIKNIESLKAPEFVLKDLNGNIYNSSDLRGSVLFINFWASWCEPCLEEMPSIENLYDHFKNDNHFRMFAVLYRDDYQKAIGYMKENDFHFPVFLDNGENAARSFGITGVPETYIIDKKGILRGKVIGPEEWNSPEAITFISNLLKE
ncbi:MAG: TlpA disulfide reductase family protein [Nitrospirota bacterium]